MTTTNDTPTAADGLQESPDWLKKGQEALTVIRAVEAGTVGDGGITYVRKHGDVLTMLTDDGVIWTMDADAPAGQSFKESEKMDAVAMRRLYNFFWPIAWAEMTEIALKLDKARKTPEEDEILRAGSTTT